MDKSAKKRYILSALSGLMILLVAVTITSVAAQYIAVGGGEKAIPIARWNATVEGRAVTKEDEEFDYYEITANPSGSEVVTQVVLTIQNLPKSVTPSVTKNEDSVFLKYDSETNLYVIDDLLPAGMTESAVYILTFSGVVPEDTDITVTPIIRQVQ